MPPEEALSLDEAAAIAKALGHPARIQVIRLLLAKRACIGCDIVDEVGLAQSTVSEHLRILKAASIITGEIDGPRVCYSLNAASLVPLANLLNAVVTRAPRSMRCAPVRRSPATTNSKSTRPGRR